MTRNIITYTLLTAVGIALYLLARDAAYAFRGYRAAGGEVFMLGLPLVWWFVRDAVRTVKEEREEA